MQPLSKINLNSSLQNSLLSVLRSPGDALSLNRFCTTSVWSLHVKLLCVFSCSVLMLWLVGAGSVNINYINESVISPAVMRRNHTHAYSSTHDEPTGERRLREERGSGMFVGLFVKLSSSGQWVKIKTWIFLANPSPDSKKATSEKSSTLLLCCWRLMWKHVNLFSAYTSLLAETHRQSSLCTAVHPSGSPDRWRLPLYVQGARPLLAPPF